MSIFHLLLVNFPVVSGGFALLAGTGATLAGLSGAVPGLMAVGTMGLFGELIQFQSDVIIN